MLGKFYLVDAGYTTMPGFISPYRGVRYHLKEIEGLRPENPRELFNFRHSSLRSAIERAFAMLKNRFQVLDNTKPKYSIQIQVDFVLACAVLHNYILGVDPNDSIFNGVQSGADVNLDAQNLDTQQGSQHLTQSQQRAANQEWVAKRDAIAQEMWDEFQRVCD
jgi:hypothetical protein